jgi:hypothetical protein
MLDRPAQEALLNHRAILLLWLALVAVSLAAMVEEVRRRSVVHVWWGTTKLAPRCALRAAATLCWTNGPATSR